MYLMNCSASSSLFFCLHHHQFNHHNMAFRPLIISFSYLIATTEESPPTSPNLYSSNTFTAYSDGHYRKV